MVVRKSTWFGIIISTFIVIYLIYYFMISSRPRPTLVEIESQKYEEQIELTVKQDLELLDSSKDDHLKGPALFRIAQVYKNREKAMNLIRNALGQEQSPAILRNAILGFSYLPYEKKDFVFLEKYIGHSDEQVRNAVYQTLSKVKSERSKTLLLNVFAGLKFKSPTEQFQICQSLLSIDNSDSIKNDCQRPLMDIMYQDDASDKAKSLKVETYNLLLKEYSYRPEIDHFINNFMKGPENFLFKSLTLNYFARKNQQRAIEIIRKFKTTKDLSFKLSIIQAIGMTCPGDSAAILKEMLELEELPVLREALITSLFLSGKQAGKDFITAPTTHKQLKFTDQEKDLITNLKTQLTEKTVRDNCF